MNQFVESLARLYNSGQVKKTVIDNLFASGKINRQEYDYIIIALIPEKER